MAYPVLQVAVLASGRGSNLHHLLAACHSGVVQARVSLVISDQAAGALEVARSSGVPHVVSLPKQPGEKSSEYDLRLGEVLATHKPDVVVLAGWLRVVGASLCKEYQGRIVNVHPALLPSFKGLKAVRQALAAGVGIAGCTTHLVTADLDAGPILLQAAIPVRRDESEEQLARRILRLEHLLVPRTVQLFAEGRVQDGRILPGDSWLTNPRVELVSGALYSEGF